MTPARGTEWALSARMLDRLYELKSFSILRNDLAAQLFSVVSGKPESRCSVALCVNGVVPVPLANQVAFQLSRAFFAEAQSFTRPKKSHAAHWPSYLPHASPEASVNSSMARYSCRRAVAVKTDC
jgi:hypothetical protein